MTRDGMIATCPLTKEECNERCAWSVNDRCAFLQVVKALVGTERNTGQAAGALVNIGHNTDGLVG